MHSFEMEFYACQWETKLGEDFYEGQNRHMYTLFYHQY
jgi:hypothetical protein